MVLLPSRNRCYLQFAVALTLSTGIFYYFQYTVNDAQDWTESTIAAATNNFSYLNDIELQLVKVEILYLKQFVHLLWLCDTINDRYVFGTYDDFGGAIVIGRLIIYQMANSSNGDYIRFTRDGDVRAVHGLQVVQKHLFGREMWIPLKKSEFIRKWNNGRFLDCMRLNVSSDQSTPVISHSFINNVATFRDFIEAYHSEPFLFGGTLLGWYRECSFIKDTTDVDLAMKIVSLNATMLKDAENSQDFSLFWILGKMNDSLELSVYSDGIKIDLFFLYEEQDSAWVGGMIASERKKLRWVYPSIPEFCTADLLGRLFYVPCNVEEVLEADYGVTWMIPHPTINFTWYSSHKNIHEVGYWSESEWKSVYKQF